MVPVSTSLRPAHMSLFMLAQANGSANHKPFVNKQAMFLR